MIMSKIEYTKGICQKVQQILSLAIFFGTSLLLEIFINCCRFQENEVRIQQSGTFKAIRN